MMKKEGEMQATKDSLVNVKFNPVTTKIDEIRIIQCVFVRNERIRKKKVSPREMKY